MADANVQIEKVHIQKASLDELQKFVKENPDLLKGKSFEITIGSDPGSSSGPTQAQVYDQMMQSIRQWGTTRYILFPLYLTLTAVLTLAFYKNDTWIPSWQLAVAGVLATVAWLIFERALSKSLQFTWDEVTKIIGSARVFPAGGPDPLAHRTKLPNVVTSARYTFYAIYWICGLYWALLLLQELSGFKVCWQQC